MKLAVYTNGQWLTVKTDPRLSTTLFVRPEDGDHIEVAASLIDRVWFQKKGIIVPDPGEHEHQIDIIV